MAGSSFILRLTFTTFLLFLLPTVLASCKDHPAYSKALTPVLVTHWDFANPSPTAQQPAYLARYKGHTYTPVNNPKSAKYAGLDLFYPLAGPHRAIPMWFQRRATVYVFVTFPNKLFNPNKKFRLRSWKSVGWATRSGGTDTITYGVHQKFERPMPTYVYVFKKRVKKKIILPDTAEIRKATSSNSYFALIAETNGNPSPDVGKFKGRTIKPNARCPDVLHDVWMVSDPNKADPDTHGKRFRTYHPPWDPCFWCAYDHDHGGDPSVFGYKPMYDYTAFKNGRQDESNEGFKGYIFSFGKYWVYFNLHVQASSTRRVSVAFHTMNIVVAEKKTKTIVMDIRFKADFGFVAVFTKKRGLLPINAANKRIRAKLTQKLFRSINVLNPDNPNRKFLLKNRDLRRGVYEEWQTIPICSEPVTNNRGVQFTFKTPGTGILSLTNTKPVPLGRTFRGHFFRSLNLYRTVKFRRVTLGAEFCPLKSGGVFYTDPTGKTVLKGPGPTAVRQYVKPGLRLHLAGKHEVTDPWKGLYTRDKRGFFRDHGFGLDPDLV